MFSTDDIQIKNINHLGLVAGIIDDIGLEKIINEVIGEDPRELITSGQVVKGMILNPTFRTSVCHIKSSLKKHGFLGINTCHFLVCLRSQLKKLA